MLLAVVNHAKIEDRQEWGKLVHGAREESRVSDVACQPSGSRDSRVFATGNGQFGLTRYTTVTPWAICISLSSSGCLEHLDGDILRYSTSDCGCQMSIFIGPPAVDGISSEPFCALRYLKSSIVNAGKCSMTWS
jgi:hypothetical protein